MSLLVGYLLRRVASTFLAWCEYRYLMILFLCLSLVDIISINNIIAFIVIEIVVVAHASTKSNLKIDVRSTGRSKFASFEIYRSFWMWSIVRTLGQNGAVRCYVSNWSMLSCFFFAFLRTLRSANCTMYVMYYVLRSCREIFSSRTKNFHISDRQCLSFVCVLHPL